MCKDMRGEREDTLWLIKSAFNLAVPHFGAIIMQPIMICSQFPTEVITSMITVYEEKENTE